MCFVTAAILLALALLEVLGVSSDGRNVGFAAVMAAWSVIFVIGGLHKGGCTCQSS